MVAPLRIGIDLGGSKIEIIALDADGSIRERRRIESPAQSYAQTVAAVRDLVLSTEINLRSRGTVGVGIPGAISPATGLVKNANSTWLIGHPFNRDLSDTLQRPVRVANDANCFALSEAVDGSGKNHRVVFGVIIGTGCGGGISVDQNIITGPNAVAGEWGHNPLPWPDDGERPGLACYCGKTGCVETWVAGPGLSRDFFVHTGQTATAVEIAHRAARGDNAAEMALARHEHRLAKALASLVNTLDPDVIVLGGGLSNIDRLYTNLLPLMERYAFSDTITTPVVKNTWGDSGGVRGAAWLWGASTP